MLEAAAQLADMDVDGALVAFGIHSPDFVHNLHAGKDAAWAGKQFEKQLKLLLRKGFARAGAGDGQLRAVQHRLPDAQEMLAHNAKAAQKRVHAQNQLLDIDGLNHVIIHARLKAAAFILNAVPGGNKQDGEGITRRAEAFQKRKAVGIRHHNVADNQVHMPLVHPVKRLAPIGGG